MFLTQLLKRSLLTPPPPISHPMDSQLSARFHAMCRVGHLAPHSRADAHPEYRLPASRIYNPEGGPKRNSRYSREDRPQDIDAGGREGSSSGN